MIPARTTKPGELCKRFNELVIARIRDVDTLVLAASWLNYFGSNDDPQVGLAFTARLAATIRLALPNVKRIIVLGPTPHLRDSAVRCMEQSNLAACAIDRRTYDAQAAAARKGLISLAAISEKIRYVETAGFFCTADSCPVLKDGYSLYWDDNHVSSTAARHFAEQYLATER